MWEWLGFSLSGRSSNKFDCNPVMLSISKTNLDSIAEIATKNDKFANDNCLPFRSF